MGHAAGGHTLENVGALLRQEISEADSAARYGGEELLLILSETEQCCACIGLERIRKAVELKAGVAISIGVTSFRPGCCSAQTLREADDALYLAKANGRNRVEWSALTQNACHEATT
ncbi:MAG: GGDEF domain-containing protein, partial [Desulfobulbaceae bacterium]|nr:GGDEF domain-containing protein [Desulfobulbaceae bacterium]